MLILARKPNESIVIDAAGVQIWVKVLGVHGKIVTLGVQAPLAFAVAREEVWQPRAIAKSGGPEIT